MLSASRFPPPGRLVPIGPNTLHIRVSGQAGPVVVFEAGVAASSVSWALVEPEVAKFATTVTYDRAGLGWSSAAATPRIPSVIAGELKSLLAAVDIEPPYLLVGHSFGGLVVERFAADYPEYVQGVVLVDPLRAFEWLDPDPQPTAMLARGVKLSRRGAMLARLGVVRLSLSLLLSGNRVLPRFAALASSGSGGSGFMDRMAGEIRKLPRELWPVVAWHWSQWKSFEGMARHLEALPASSREMMDCVVDPSIPGISLVAEPIRAQGAAHFDVECIEDCGHWVQFDRPDLVVSAIRRLAGRFRPESTREWSRSRPSTRPR